MVTAVLLPYVKDKVDRLYQNWSDESDDERGPTGNHQQQLWHRLRRWAHPTLMCTYPVINVLYEGSLFCFQWLYLYRKTLYFDPMLAMTRQIVRRTTKEELEVERKNIVASASKGMDRNNSDGNKHSSNEPHHLSGISEGKNGEHSTRYGQWVLIIVLLAFKAVEWWVTTDEEDRGWYLRRNHRSSLLSNRITPSPPSQPIPSDRGLPVPENINVCALCGNNRINPVILRVSGFVFCYRCALEHLRSVGKCPITLLPCKVNDLCKIYDEEGAAPP